MSDEPDALPDSLADELPDSLADVPAHDRPRERMRRIGIGALTDDEVLALVLGSGQSGRSVLAFARSILRRTGGFPGLATMDFARLESLPGVGSGHGGAPGRHHRDLAPRGQLLLVDAARRPCRHRQGGRARADAPRRRTVRRGGRRPGIASHRAGRDARRRPSTRRASSRPTSCSRCWCAAAVRSRSRTTIPAGSLDPSVADHMLTRRLDQAAATIGLRFLGHILVAGGEWRPLASNAATAAGVSGRGRGRSSLGGSTGAA